MNVFAFCGAHSYRLTFPHILRKPLRHIHVLREAVSVTSHSSTFVFSQSRHKMSDNAKPRVLFVLGPPGSGKGTQCTRIVERFQFIHLSAGDLLRAERNTAGSPYGTLIETHITNGTIVPVEITCSLIDRAIQASDSRHFLIDGFPRNEDNLSGWTREMEGKVEILGVLFLECTESTCNKRCLDRGAAGSGRSDDNAESLRKRFLTYQNDTLGIINHYKKLDMVYSVDTSIRTAEQVFEEVQAVITKIAPGTEK